MPLHLLLSLAPRAEQLRAVVSRGFGCGNHQPLARPRPADAETAGVGQSPRFHHARQRQARRLSAAASIATAGAGVHAIKHGPLAAAHGRTIAHLPGPCAAVSGADPATEPSLPKRVEETLGGTDGRRQARHSGTLSLGCSYALRGHQARRTNSAMARATCCPATQPGRPERPERRRAHPQAQLVRTHLHGPARLGSSGQWSKRAGKAMETDPWCV